MFAKMNCYEAHRRHIKRCSKCHVSSSFQMQTANRSQDRAFNRLQQGCHRRDRCLRRGVDKSVRIQPLKKNGLPSALPTTGSMPLSTSQSTKVGARNYPTDAVIEGLLSSPLGSAWQDDPDGAQALSWKHPRCHHQARGLPHSWCDGGQDSSFSKETGPSLWSASATE